MAKNRVQVDFYVVETAVFTTISAIATIAYLRVGLARLFYPFALDLVEEDMLMQAWRVAQGLPVFVQPNATFVPQVYMPLFTWLGGQLLRLTGFAFWPLRLISFLSALGTAVLLIWIGWRESRNRTAALVGGALFLAGYRLVGGWYDLARVDALFAFLSLLGLTMAVYGRSPLKKGLLAGLILGMALLTKQNGFLLAIVAGLYLFVAGRGEEEQKFPSTRTILFFAATFLLVAGLPIFALQTVSNGWFGHYVGKVAFASPLEPVRLWYIFWWELVAGMGVLLAMWLGTAVSQIGKTRQAATFRNFSRVITCNPWLIFVGTAVFVSVAGRATVGGNLNNMILGYAFLCLAPALSLAHFPAVKNERYWILRVGILLQFGLLFFPLNSNLPKTYAPTQAMRAAGSVLLANLANVEGEVWLLNHPSYAVMAGKRPYVHLQSLWHARLRGEDPLPSDLVQRLEAQQFSQIISSESDFFEKEPAFLELLLTHYEAIATLTDEQSPATLSGLIIRPLTVYAPRP